MVRLQVEVLPQSSVAVQVRVTLKLAGQLPGVVASLNVIATLGSQASVAVATPNDGVEPQATGDTTAGQVIDGGIRSCTAMVRLQVDVLPQSSVAVQVRVTLKLAGQLPGVVASLNVMATLGSQASVAVATPNDGVEPQATGDTTAGQVIDGGIKS